MAIQDASPFDCPNCETIVASTRIRYDELGYPVCPGCAHTTAPVDTD